MRGVLIRMGRFIATCIGVTLGLVLAIVAAPWIILKTFEVLARILA